MGMMEVCGALTGGLMLAGLKNSAGVESPGTTKGSTYKLNRTLGQAFQQSTGSVLCHELKGRDTGTPLCPVIPVFSRVPRTCRKISIISKINKSSQVFHVHHTKISLERAFLYSGSIFIAFPDSLMLTKSTKKIQARVTNDYTNSSGFSKICE